MRKIIKEQDDNFNTDQTTTDTDNSYYSGSNTTDTNSSIGKVVKDKPVAPKQEMDLLLQLQQKQEKPGTIQNLIVDDEGYPELVQLEDRTYTVAIKTEKGNYIVYDGRVLQPYADSYTYMKRKDTETGQMAPVYIKTEVRELVPPTELLNSLGMEYNVNIYRTINKMKNILQKYINNGSVSQYFDSFNKLLKYYYPYDNDVRLKPPLNKTFRLPDDTQELSQKYRQSNDASRFGIKFTIYEPIGPPSNLVGRAEVQYNKEDCKTKLKDFYVSAIEKKSTGLRNMTPKQMNDYKTTIKFCLGKGAYDDFTGFTKQDLKDLQVTKKNIPFNLFNNKITYREIKKDLEDIGGDWALLESKLTKKPLIKERLQRLKQENNIVKTRFNLLTENKNQKIKKEKLFKDILSELRYMNNQKFSSKIINENFFRMIEGVFGETSGHVMDQFRKYLSDWLVEKLCSKNESTWISTEIKNIVMTTSDSEIPQLLDCSHLSREIAEKISKKSLSRIEDSNSSEGKVQKVLKTVMLDCLQGGSISEKLQAKLTKDLCPLMDELNNKLEKKAEKIKEKVLQKD